MPFEADVTVRVKLTREPVGGEIAVVRENIARALKGLTAVHTVDLGDGRVHTRIGVFEAVAIDFKPRED